MALATPSPWQLEVASASKVLEALGTPVSLGVYLRLKYAPIDTSLYKELSQLRVEGKDYTSRDIGKFADDYQAVSLLRKSPHLPTGVDKEAAAIETFFDCEETCRQTNVRLHHQLSVGLMPDWWKRFVRNIRMIMGPLGKPELSRIEELMCFSSGTNVGLDKTFTTRNGKSYYSLSDKLRSKPTLTSDLFAFRSAFAGLLHGPCTIAEAERFTSVAKDSTKNRGIAPQAIGNSFVQNGIGRFLAERLLVFGIDIRDQSFNQTLARMAYQLGLCTTDLTSASDLICRELVRSGADWRWYKLLDLARHRYCDVPTDAGVVRVRLERFCSMGNGFTFPLETIIFISLLWAIIPACDRVCVNAYGDDLVFPANYRSDVWDALGFLGFQVNEKKSFWQGGFFESCGYDYFYGQNVRPFFFTRDEEGAVPYALTLANKVRIYAKRRGILGCCDRRFHHVWNYLRSSIPPGWDNPVPPQFGDLGLISPRPGNLRRNADGSVPVRVTYRTSRLRKVRDMAGLMYVIAASAGRQAPEWLSPETEETLDDLRDFLVELGAIPEQMGDPIPRLYGRPLTKDVSTCMWERGWEWL
jgi:hypothetical protein